MIHYHGTPITPMTELAKMRGRNFCVSFAAPYDKARCLAIGQSVMWDNGAFSIFTQGGTLDINAFYSWVEDGLAHPHWAVVPDRIGGSVDEQRAMTKTWPFQREYGAPVWHLNLPIDYLLELADTWPRVCLGSSGEFWKVGSSAWCKRMDEVFNELHARRTHLPWIHGLRMLSMCSAEWPLASADSTNVAQNFKTRKIDPDRMAADIDGQNPPLGWKPRALQQELLDVALV